MTITYWTAKELDAYKSPLCPKCKCQNIMKTGRLKEAQCPICQTIFKLTDAIKYKSLDNFIPAGEFKGWIVEEI